jgi:hypothetical protein
MRVCKYSLERCRSYLQLLCIRSLLNLYRLRSATVLAIITHLGQILSKNVKLNEESCHLEIQTQGITSRTSFSPNCPRSSVRKIILARLETKLFSAFYSNPCFLAVFRLRYFGSAYPSKACMDVFKT